MVGDLLLHQIISGSSRGSFNSHSFNFSLTHSFHIPKTSNYSSCVFFDCFLQTFSIASLVQFQHFSPVFSSPKIFPVSTLHFFLMIFHWEPEGNRYLVSFLLPPFIGFSFSFLEVTLTPQFLHCQRWKKTFVRLLRMLEVSPRKKGH